MHFFQGSRYEFGNVSGHRHEDIGRSGFSHAQQEEVWKAAESPVLSWGADEKVLHV